MSGVNNATEQTSTSSATTTFESAVIFNIAVTAATFISFDLIRKRVAKVFEPRTYIVPENKRSPPVPSGFLKWLRPTLKTSDEEIVLKAGLDGYMFLRVIRTFMILFTAFTALGIGLILPVNRIGQYDKPGLESFTIGNVKDKERLYAHVIVCYLFTAAILYMMYNEYYTYIRLRNEYLTTPEHRVSARATTILVLGIPPELNNPEDLKSLFGVFPGGVKRIWINRDPANLVNLTTKRLKTINKLEQAETIFLEKSLKYVVKDSGSEQDVEDGNKIPASLRPTHKTIPLIGKKVDSIETYRDEIKHLNEEIGKQRDKEDSLKLLNSAFIQFNDYMGAQLAATLTIPRLTEISREDVIWENLNFSRTSRIIRKTISFSVTTALIVLCTLSELSKIVPFLTPLVNKLPPSAIGIIQLINVLLVTASANGIFNAIPTIIQEPTSIVSSLAQNLPLASTFFLTYVLLSLSTAAMEALQIGSLVMYFITKMFLAKTPRQIFYNETTLMYKDWGVTFPPHILMASIGLVYSVIQPLILPFTALRFALFYLAYRYNFLYVYDQIYETNGDLFINAMKSFFWGIFVFHLTMIGLMFLNEAFIAGVLLVVLFVITLALVLAMRHHFKHNPKAEFLPADLLGVIEMKTKKVIIDKNFTKSITEDVEYDEKADQGFSGSTSQQLSEKPLADIDDEYINPNVVHIKHANVDKEGDANTYKHPALIIKNPLVWIPQDSTDMYKDEVKGCRESGLNATSQGAAINENYKVEVDIDKAPNIKDELFVENAESWEDKQNVTD
ncbi:22968_t:CDS:2 [Dentiscutata erythropus]|uniref:22968_t:CDS:1 n=1 Tax=Dentiscutata erythropus TaxID=1348616 RepID=A0A9N9I6Y2_9GLOM|nr:22968_t:CDS:2 [Dentiscutata erythropus]